MSGKIIEMLIDYETLVAAVKESLLGKCPGWVDLDKESDIGCTVFKLRHWQLGDNLGEVKVRKVGDRSELSFSGPQRLPNCFSTQEEMDALKAARPDLDFTHRCAELSRKEREEGNELHRQREEHFDKVIRAMFNGLYHDVTLQRALQAKDNELVIRALTGLAGEELELKAEPQADSGKVDKEGPRVPSRPKDFKTWQVIWQKVKGQWDQGKNYQEMSEWLFKMHPQLACSPDILADIIRAGEAGRLRPTSTNSH